MRVSFAIIISCLLSSIAAAQSESRQAAQSIGVGQREDAAKIAPNVIPMARVSQRLQTRIGTRINNRLIRGIGSTASFAAANAQVQKTKPTK
jgi:hypothetical protein